MVQLSLLGLALFLSNMAYRSWLAYSSAEPNTRLDEVVVVGAVALVCAAGCLWMGVRTVRGPQPPSLD